MVVKLYHYFWSMDIPENVWAKSRELNFLGPFEGYFKWYEFF